MTLELPPGNVTAIAVSVVGFILAMALLWQLVPRLINRFLRWMDSIVLLDVVEFARPVSLTILLVLGAMLLAAALLAVLTQLGMDTTGVQAAARAYGAAVFNWFVPKVLRLVIIVILTLLALRLTHRHSPKLVRLFLKSRSDQQGVVEVEKRATTLQSVVDGSLAIFILLVALFTALSELGVPIGPVLAGVGIAGIAIGFGAQTLIKDVIAGFFILMEDQYRVGDVVRIAGTAGLVEDINLRRTVLRDLDFIQHFIPNGDIGVASNFTKEKSRVNLNIQVAYKEDLDQVIDVLNRVGEEMSHDEYFGPLITDQLKVLRVDSFDESGISIKVLGETLPLRQWEVAGEFRKRVKRVFDSVGIEIPFPHRTLYWGKGVETRLRQLIDEHQDGKGGQRQDTPSFKHQEEGAE